MESIESLTCPFCDSKKTMSIYYQDRYRIECFNCSSFTPSSTSRVEARKLWTKEIIYKNTFANKIKRYFKKI